MLIVALVFTLAIVIHYIYESSNRKKYLEDISKIIKKYDRVKSSVTLYDFLVFLCFFVLAYKRHEYAFMYIPILISRILDKIRLNDEIVLLDDGLIFNKSYIKLSSMDKFYSEGKSILVVCSKGLKGKFKIANIKWANELESDIRDIKSSNMF